MDKSDCSDIAEMQMKVKNGFLGTLRGVTESELNPRQNLKEGVTLDKYQRIMDAGELIDVIQFSQGQAEKGLYKFENGVEIFLPVEEIRKDKKYLPMQYFNRVYTVEVIDVDRENKRVTVSFLRAQNRTRPAVYKEISEQVKAGKKVRVQARIDWICRKEDRVGAYAFVDIFGLGITGVVLAKDWGYGYVKDISNYAKIGDVIDCVIIEYNKRGSKDFAEFRVSRKLALKEDPWESVEERFPLRSRVIVECIGCYDNNFIGKVEGLEELAAYCYYPKVGRISSITNEEFVVHVGGRYIGNVSKVDAEKRQLQVRVYDEVQTVNETP